MRSVPEELELSYPDHAHFWAWVEKGPDCWEWQGNKGDGGYGRVTLGGRRWLAHRIAWLIANGPIPAGLVIDHKCFNVACVNPEHLRLATQKQNMEHRKAVRAKSGFRGVYRAGDKWRGHVKHSRKTYYTTTCDTPEEAHIAVVALRNSLFTHNILDRSA